MKRGSSGHYLTTSTAGGETVRAFLPHPLPPTPNLDISAELRNQLDEALLSLGRLDSVTALLPDTQLFLYMYVRKEAVLSSQIEGTQSSLSDLLLFEAEEAPGVPMDDVVEVSSYVAAMEHGLARLRTGFPLSNRLICEIHGVLLARGRGADKDPGQFRRSQNWIGGTRPGNAVFVPAPPQEIPALMGQLELYLHDQPVKSPVLIKAALAHVQFETIHPFLDGNGRVGRLLITLLLCSQGVLSQPLLYLSLYLKKHRTRYYELLDRVRTDGTWELWLAFFVEGVIESARGAVITAQRLSSLSADDRQLARGLGRGTTTLEILRCLEERPIITVTQLAARSGVSFVTATKALAQLEGAGIVREMTGRKRNRVFSYEKYLNILNEGTAPAS
ncbi:MAG: filamentation induced by cAMP protein Fic [Gemmatimonadetes bacterium]|nr:filamentation induced by cAMP protein Fic [Gemmatimonadota bacterium]